MVRKKTKRIYIGSVPIGDGAPVVVQSMTKTDTRDVSRTVRQIRRLQREGCEVVRLAIPDPEAVDALREIKKRVEIPLIADIHFDWRLAIGAIEAGIDALRINPGNIGSKWKVREIVEVAKDRQIPIRIGANSGSIPVHLRKKYGRACPEALVEAVEEQMAILEGMDFRLIKVSLKGTDVSLTIEAYRAFSERYEYPLHIGITEAGPPPMGIVKSSVGLGILLSEGIGDTIRVSLTAEPWQEVKVAYEILSSLGIRHRGVELISCPTCGRCGVDVIKMAKSLQRRLKAVEKSYKVAVMGCAVNGPGEASDADFGIAGAKGYGIVFKKGKVVSKVPKDRLLETLMEVMKQEDGDD